MIITYKNFKNIEFPVYLLNSDNWYYEDGILLLDGMVLDDRNMPGDTLGKRRLQTPMRNLYPISKGVMDAIGIIKNKNHQTYIDSIGRLFTYEKTMFAKLKHYKIRKVEKKKSFSLLWVAGLNFPFTIPRPPPKGFTWASVLHVDGYPWKLYGYSETRQKDTNRKI